MKKILVALDNSPIAKSVVAAANTFGDLLGLEPEALHVQTDGVLTAAGAAESAGTPLRIVTGNVIERLVESGRDESVAALAVGARGAPATDRPLGSSAAAIATGVLKPVVVVPPNAEPPARFQRVLVPLEGTVSTSLAPLEMFELADGAELDVVAVHVHDPRSLPAFTDQPQHEQEAWTREFLHRYCPWGLREVRLETRVGRRGEVVPLVAEEFDCDLIVLGWARQLSAGRAPVIQQTLARSNRPVLLIPVRVVHGARRSAVAAVA